jgi:hypothetical protein
VGTIAAKHRTAVPFNLAANGAFSALERSRDLGNVKSSQAQCCKLISFVSAEAGVHEGFLDFSGSASQEVLPILSHPPRLLLLSTLHFVLEFRAKKRGTGVAFFWLLFLAKQEK